MHREEIPLHAPVPLPLLSLLLLLALSALPLRVQAAPPPSSPAPARQESSPSQATPVQAMAEPIRIGVLATRGPALARAQWQPLLRWLALRVPGHRFVLHPLGLDELAEAVAREHLDFVITNPGQSVSLARQYPLAWLATLKSPAGGDNLAIGAALVVPAQTPYQHWRDLEGQAVAAVSENAFGGYLAFRFEAGEQGVRLERFFSTVQFTGFPLDRLIERLAAGEVAAAIVPVCQLERMEREGKVARGAFRVLDDQAPAGFGCQSSTRLYPNWSFAKTERASPALALAVTARCTICPLIARRPSPPIRRAGPCPPASSPSTACSRRWIATRCRAPGGKRPGTGCASISSGAGAPWRWCCCWGATTCCCNTCSTAASAGCSKPATSSSRRDASWHRPDGSPNWASWAPTWPTRSISP
ncbi:phosphate/phosphite/phosphonate ABC transporter substrate-binding protein [Aeromonas caviae]